jgi:hypothetical protein
MDAVTAPSCLLDRPDADSRPTVGRSTHFDLFRAVMYSRFESLAGSADVSGGRRTGIEAIRVRRTEQAMWRSELDRATALTARLDADGQLEPIGVDESLTTALFAAPSERAAAARRESIAAEAAVAESVPVHAQGALFELA